MKHRIIGTNGRIGTNSSKNGGAKMYNGTARPQTQNFSTSGAYSRGYARPDRRIGDRRQYGLKNTRMLRLSPGRGNIFPRSIF